MANREPKLLLGPLVVVAVLASAQCGAYALDAWPRSTVLWYLNLEVFRPVQYSLFMADGVDPTGVTQAFGMVFALLVLICSGLFGKARLPLAIASNLSFLYSVVLLYGFYAANNRALVVDIHLNALWSPSFPFIVALLFASF